MCVVALEEEDSVGVVVCTSTFRAVEEAVQHGYKLCRIFDCIDADEVQVMSTRDVTDYPSLDGSGPFKVPPEGAGLAVAPLWHEGWHCI